MKIRMCTINTIACLVVVVYCWLCWLLRYCWLYIWSIWSRWYMSSLLCVLLLFHLVVLFRSLPWLEAKAGDLLGWTAPGRACVLASDFFGFGGKAQDFSDLPREISRDNRFFFREISRGNPDFYWISMGFPRNFYEISMIFLIGFGPFSQTHPFTKLCIVGF